jgi:hypothetical protein
MNRLTSDFSNRIRPPRCTEPRTGRRNFPSGRRYPLYRRMSVRLLQRKMARTSADKRNGDEFISGIATAEYCFRLCMDAEPLLQVPRPTVPSGARCVVPSHCSYGSLVVGRLFWLPLVFPRTHRASFEGSNQPTYFVFTNRILVLRTNVKQNVKQCHPHPATFACRVRTEAARMLCASQSGHQLCRGTAGPSSDRHHQCGPAPWEPRVHSRN